MNLLWSVVCGALVITEPALAEKVPPIGDEQPAVLLTLSVGDGTITGEHLTPYRIAWHGTLYPENEQPIDGGIWVQQLRRVEEGGREVLVRTAGAILFRRTSFSWFTENAPYPVRMTTPATPGVPRTVYELVD